MVASVVVSIVCLVIVGYTVRKRALWRTGMAAVASVALVAPLAALPSPVAAAQGHSAVLAAYASPSSLPSTGGTAMAIGKVRDASTCRVAVLGDHGVKVSLPKPASCSDGQYHERLGFGPNVGQAPVVVKLGLLAGSSRGVFYVVVAASPAHPAVLEARAYPWELPAKGGWTLVIGHTRDAKTCHLVALGWKHPVLPSQSCSAGTFTEKLWLSPNEKHVAESQAFELVAAGNATAMGKFFVRLAPAPVPPAVTTTTSVASSPATSTPPVTSGLTTGAPPPFFPPPPTTTTTVAPTTTTTVAPTTTTTVAPTTTTTVAPTTTTTTPTPTTVLTSTSTSLVQGPSDNWSGYVAAGGGPYTVVAGTFTVSSLTTGTPAGDAMDEWVGIDGMGGTSGASDLIQAGIMESMVPCSGTGQDLSGPYNPDEFYICPWSFFIENGQGSEGPVPQLTISPGDSVTVEIWQQSGTDWAVAMTDTTTGQSWSVGDQYYAGPGFSAEWIVEDPGVPGEGCDVSGPNGLGQCPMAPYSPPVTFSDLGLTPTAVTTWYELTLLQSGIDVSTSSAFSSGGTFTVSYTGGTSPGTEVGTSSGHPITDLPTPVLPENNHVPAGPTGAPEGP